MAAARILCQRARSKQRLLRQFQDDRVWEKRDRETILIARRKQERARVRKHLESALEQILRDTKKSLKEALQRLLPGLSGKCGYDGMGFVLKESGRRAKLTAKNEHEAPVWVRFVSLRWESSSIHADSGWQRLEAFAETTYTVANANSAVFVEWRTREATNGAAIKLRFH